MNFLLKSALQFSPREAFDCAMAFVRVEEGERVVEEVEGEGVGAVVTAVFTCNPSTYEARMKHIHTHTHTHHTTKKKKR